MGHIWATINDTLTLNDVLTTTIGIILLYFFYNNFFKNFLIIFKVDPNLNKINYKFKNFLE